MEKIKNTIIYKKIVEFIETDNKYEISIMAATISFYMIISIVSIFIFAFQLINKVTSRLSDFLISKIFEIFQTSFYSLISDIIPEITINLFTVFILFNIIWSLSRMINVYNKVSDKIYSEIAKRNWIKNKVSSIIMSLMLIVVVLFEIAVLVYSTIIINKLGNYIIIRLLEMLIELTFLFFTMSILYIYLPPKKMKLKKVLKGSFFTTLSIYIVLEVFVLLIWLLSKINIVISIITIISFSLTLLFIINYTIIGGLIINYHKEKSNCLEKSTDD